ncbi:MAG: 3'-5' exonuclease [Acidimicrobiales bacterium]
MKSKLRELTRPGVDLRRAVADLVDTSEGAEPSTLTPAEIERRQNVDALGNLIRDYLAVDPMPNGPGLAAWIATIQAGEVATDTDAVDLATFHAAKGLEWPVVHLAGIEAGFVPISYSRDRRTARRGATSALRCGDPSRARTPSVMGRQPDLRHLRRRRTPSPYERISGAIEHLTSGQRPLDWRAKVEDSRTTLEVAAATTVDVRAPRPPNDKLFDMLQAWRRDRRAADVPPHVVCNDQTLSSRRRTDQPGSGRRRRSRASVPPSSNATATNSSRSSGRRTTPDRFARPAPLGQVA